MTLDGSRHTRLILSLLVFSSIFASFLLSCSGEPSLSLSSATFVPSRMLPGTASAFMDISNDGTGDDMLIGCSLREYPEARCMLHDVIDGKMKMVTAIEIPHDSTTSLKRGERHLMFSRLPEKLGERITIQLDFKRSGKIPVTTLVIRHK